MVVTKLSGYWLVSDEKLVICDSFSIDQDVPRTLKSGQEGIKANLDGLIEPELLQRLNYDNYIFQTTHQKPRERRLRESATISRILLRDSNTRALEGLEDTTGWIITFVTTIKRIILKSSANYLEACDNLREKSTYAIRESPYGFTLSGADRDDKGLSLRTCSFGVPPMMHRGFPHLQNIGKHEPVPFKSIYPDSDFEDVYIDDELN
jgi:hypothetical protein